MLTVDKRILPYLFICSALLTSCSSIKIPSSEQIENSAAEEALKSSSLPEKLIESTEEKLSKISDDRLDFYSPLHIENAKESLLLAKQYLATPSKDIKNAALMSAIAAQKYIESAYTNKKLVQKTLKEPLSYLSVLERLEAKKHIPEPYQQALDLISERIFLIENSKANEATQNLQSLLDKLAHIEIKAVKAVYLEEALSYLEKSEVINADRYAPSSFAEAKEELTNANLFIDKHFRDIEEIKKISDIANTKMAHAFFVAEHSKEISSLSDSEKYVLTRINKLNALHQEIESETLPPIEVSKIPDIVHSKLKQVLDAYREIPVPVLTPASESDQINNLEKESTNENTGIQKQEINEAIKKLANPEIQNNQRAVLDDFETEPDVDLNEDEQSFDDEEVMDMN